MRSPRRGEIYRLKSDAVGKPRPVLIVSRNELNSGIYVVAIPYYSEQVESRRTRTRPLAECAHVAQLAR